MNYFNRNLPGNLVIQTKSRVNCIKYCSGIRYKRASVHLKLYSYLRSSKTNSFYDFSKVVYSTSDCSGVYR